MYEEYTNHIKTRPDLTQPVLDTPMKRYINRLVNMEPNPWVRYVAAFHSEKLPFSYHPDHPDLASPVDALQEISSLTKEVEELFTAMAQGDIVEIADGAVDCIYVLIGICLKYGVDPTPIMEEVQRSNMDKLPAGPGTIGRRTSDGRICKPDDWVPPCVKEILTAQGWKE